MYIYAIKIIKIKQMFVFLFSRLFIPQVFKLIKSAVSIQDSNFVPQNFTGFAEEKHRHQVACCTEKKSEFLCRTLMCWM